ncbi:HAMP domain-containing sensor histidine kinase [Haploplasma axanthum]|uniref:Heme sensor protein HssS n=1 Tax=Haploplasma axanthum TaxID=29552 RepID=A0A449BBM1_HAPAX|nr:HAMP domain-containing sensor histidine kinase [Haploplasma axanthum]VEU79836.1 Alkaline phosphatase synthesis sensor protein phoR [Haploplasma axanthum]
MKNKKQKGNINLYLKFTLLFLFIMLLSGLIVSLLAFIFSLISNKEMGFILRALVATTVIGVLLTFLVSRIFLREVNKLKRGMQEISEGNFDVRLDLKHPSELKSISDNFNLMAKELSATQILRNDFISNFSHELKTPIVAIRGFAKLLQNPNLSEEKRKEFLDIIFNESNRLSQLSSNILLLTKLESQGIVIEKKEYYLDEQIRQCILLLSKEWETKNISFNLGLNKINYYGNEELLQHLWINLIGNAIKFSKKDSMIKIYLEESDNEVIATIKDSGIGMDTESIKRIYDRFFQVDSNNSAYGNGLGLSIVKRIIDLSNGTINVESKIGNGTTFIITLPKD